MTRLIDADYLLKELEDWQADLDDAFSGRQLGVTDAIVIACQMPTVDAVPVRNGKWLDPETLKRPWFRHHIFECSVCRNILDMDGVNAGRGDANYCPNCGARMDAERKEE